MTTPGHPSTASLGASTTLSRSPSRLAPVAGALRRLQHSRLLTLVIANVVLIAVTTWKEPSFLRAESFRVIIDNMAPGAFLIPVTVMLLAAGRFDLSMDGAAVLGGVAAGMAMADWGASPVVALLVGLG